MRNLIAFPLLLLAIILQTSIFSQARLLSGSADILLLTLGAWTLQDRVESAWLWGVIACLLAGFVSHLPWFIYALGYGSVIFLAQTLQKRVWQAPLLAMFSVVFLGTIAMNALTFTALRISGTPIAFADALGLIILPSLLLNMLFAVPVHAFMRDLSRWVYPAEEYA
ncbi:MAG: hypothetical protein Fur002_25880 [Anaerolineales bacterium]